MPGHSRSSDTPSWPENRAANEDFAQTVAVGTTRPLFLAQGLVKTRARASALRIKVGPGKRG